MILIRLYNETTDARPVGILIAETYRKFNLDFASPEEQAKLLGPFQHAWSAEPSHLEEIARVLRAEMIFVAEDSHEIVGVLRCRTDRLQSLFVREDHHRQGIGRMLVERCEQECASQGSTIIRVAATLYAVPFYEAMGYKKSTGIRNCWSFEGQGLKYQPMIKRLPRLSAGYAIKNVTIVDVEKGITVPGQTIIIVGERIEQIGAQETITIPRGVKTINGSKLYLMPGLVDAHVHYFDAPVFGRLMIANGILLVRDVGMPNGYILKLRDDLNRGDMLGPEMVATGAILDGNPPLIPLISIGIQTPEEGREAVHQQAEAGVDMIKVYSRLDKDVFLAILDEAHRHNLKVAAHLPETVYLEDAVQAGLDSSEHFNGFEKVIAKLLGEPVRLEFAGQAADAGYFMRLNEVNSHDLQDFYQRLHASGITICPTVVTFKTLTNISVLLDGNFPGSEYISPNVFGMWKSLWTQQSDLPDFIWKNWGRMVKELNQAGIPLMVGTDLMLPGILPGYSVHEEMAIWQEAGIPPADILRSATLVPAQFMGLGERLGSVSVGKEASIVLLRANPLEDVRNAQQIESVFLRGQYLNRKDLKQLLNEAKDMAQPTAQP